MTLPPLLSPRASLASRRAFLLDMRTLWSFVFLPLAVFALVVILALGLYARSRALMQQHLREYLRATAAAAAMQFDGMDPSLYRTEEALGTKQYARIARKLDDIRVVVPSIRYAYIMERTEDPLLLRFLADADSLKSEAELDLSGNGTVDDEEEPSFPGELYDITDVPALQGPAFERASVDDEAVLDEWGSLISGYAPIHNSKGKTVAVLGLDMQADAFEKLAQSIFSLQALMLVSAAGVLFALYIALELWKRRLESARQLEDDRRALMDLASHQLGAPLTTFKWWLEILRERDGGAFCRESDVCAQMEEGIRRMDEIVQALRSIGTDTPADQRATCNLQEVVTQAVHHTGPLLQRKRQTCTVAVPSALPCIGVDASLLVGALQELLENASIYSPEGAAVTVEAAAAGKRVHLTVRDTGDGITPEDLRRIGQKFVRGAHATDRKPVGNGLGLWIVRSIVERAGGGLRIESEPGKGTAVHVDLPTV